MNESIREVIRAQLLEAAIEKVIPKFPSNTEIHPYDKFSLWNGEIAIVFSPTYSSSVIPNLDFNPENSTRKYVVRYATDVNKKRIKDKSLVSRYYHIAEPNKPYHQTMWQIERFSYGPKDSGTFEKDVITYWVKINNKDLWPGEVMLTIKQLNSKGYFDITNISKKLKKTDWQKLAKIKTFVKTQELDFEMANAADAVVTHKLGRYAENPGEEERTWDIIKGFYNPGRKIDKILWVVDK